MTLFTNPAMKLPFANYKQGQPLFIVLLAEEALQYVTTFHRFVTESINFVIYDTEINY